MPRPKPATPATGPHEDEHEHVHGPHCDHSGDRSGDRSGHDDHAGFAGTYRRETPKLGRNDPCSCGSGLKYKKCHGAVA